MESYTITTTINYNAMFQLTLLGGWNRLGCAFKCFVSFVTIKTTVKYKSNIISGINDTICNDDDDDYNSQMFFEMCRNINDRNNFLVEIWQIIITW